MNQNELFELGYISKTVGYKGEVQVQITVHDPSVIEDIEVLYLSVGGGFVPYFPEEWKGAKAGFVRVKLEGVNTEDAARALVGTTCFLPLNLLPEQDDDSYTLPEFMGYTVFNHDGQLGTVKDVNDVPGNPILTIATAHGDVVVPAVPPFLVDFSRGERRLLMEIPPEILDLNKG